MGSALDGAWRDNPEAVGRVSALLNESGAPSEARIAAICQRLVTLYDGHQAMTVRTESLVYGDLSTGQPLREIDQVVSLYQEFELSDRYGIQLQLNVPIESKWRRGAQVFGVEVDGTKVSPGALPVNAEFGRTRLMMRSILPHLPNFMIDQELRRVAVLLFKEDMQTPARVLDENLVYKAAASLHDFIRTSLQDYESDAVRESDALDRTLMEFEDYLEKNHYWAPQVARPWLSDLPDSRFAEHAEAPRTERRMMYPVTVFCPILCSDAPMFEVALHGEDTPAYNACGILLTSARVPGWPLPSGLAMATNATGAVITIVNLQGLEQVLIDLVEYFGRLRESLRTITATDIAKLFLEQDFLASVSSSYATDSMYRSDFLPFREP